MAQATPFKRLSDDRSEEAGIKNTGGSPALQRSIPISTPAVKNEYDKLRVEDASSAQRVGRLELTASERDVLSLSVRKMNDLGSWAEAYRVRGSQLFATQILCAAGVPVLIALLGSLPSNTELPMRLIAILLSILGTATKVMEDAYDWRGQAAIRRRQLTRMRLLFDNFCVLSGELFDMAANGHAPGARKTRKEPGSGGTSYLNGGTPSAGGRAAVDPSSPQLQFADEQRNQHSGANLRRYVVAFSALEDECSARLSALHDRNNAVL